MVIDSLAYNVCRWDDKGVHILQEIAVGIDYQCTLAAYEKALTVYPRDRLTFRHGIRLIRERVPDSQS
jgi:hypothetical protein